MGKKLSKRKNQVIPPKIIKHIIEEFGLKTSENQAIFITKLVEAFVLNLMEESKGLKKEKILKCIKRKNYYFLDGIEDDFEKFLAESPENEEENLENENLDKEDEEKENFNKEDNEISNTNEQIRESTENKDDGIKNQYENIAQEDFERIETEKPVKEEIKDNYFDEMERLAFSDRAVECNVDLGPTDSTQTQSKPSQQQQALLNWSNACDNSSDETVEETSDKKEISSNQISPEMNKIRSEAGLSTNKENHKDNNSTENRDFTENENVK